MPKTKKIKEIKKKLCWQCKKVLKEFLKEERYKAWNDGYTAKEKRFFDN